MTTRTSLRLSAVLLATSYLVSCFPQLPDETLVDNLRVLAIQADPATANLLAFPAPLVTVTALVVDPDDPELRDASHTWSLELPEGVSSEDLEGLTINEKRANLNDLSLFAGQSVLVVTGGFEINHQICTHRL